MKSEARIELRERLFDHVTLDVFGLVTGYGQGKLGEESARGGLNVSKPRVDSDGHSAHNDVFVAYRDEQARLPCTYCGAAERHPP